MILVEAVKPKRHFSQKTQSPPPRQKKNNSNKNLIFCGTMNKMKLFFTMFSTYVFEFITYLKVFT